MWFEPFKYKFESFKRDPSIQMQIPTIQNGFEAFKTFECKFERDLNLSNANSNHWNGIRSIWMQIRTIQMGFKPFEWDSNP